MWPLMFKIYTAEDHNHLLIAYSLLLQFLVPYSRFSIKPSSASQKRTTESFISLSKNRPVLTLDI